jgi:predicted nucleotidyltransferase
MYSNVNVHGDNSIRTKTNKSKFFNCAYCYTNLEKKIVRPLSDLELQQIGGKLDLICGIDINKHLNGPKFGSKIKYLNSPHLLDLIDRKKNQLLLDEISNKYLIEVKDLKVIGSIQLFSKEIKNSHDIDIVVSIDSEEQLRNVFSSHKRCVEFGYIWPLRWYSRNNHLICPFFIYRGLEPPIKKVSFNGNKYNGKIVIKEDKYGIFNAPLLITDGRIDLVYCRSTLLRGMLRKGHELFLDCPLCKVVEGKYAGANVGFITNPFNEIKNIKNILSEYQT